MNFKELPIFGHNMESYRRKMKGDIEGNNQCTMYTVVRMLKRNTEPKADKQTGHLLHVHVCENNSVT